jgi:MscS family membrane protein
MRLKFDAFWKTTWVCLALVLLGSLWAGAQTNSAATNAPVATNGMESLLSFPALSGTNLTNHVYLTFGLNRVEALQREYLGNPAWQYLAFLIYVILAFYISKLFDWLLGVWLKAWTKRTKTELDDILIELLRGPVKTIAFVIFLHIGLNLFKWPAWVENLISKGFLLVVACSVTYLLLKLVDILLTRWVKRSVSADDKPLNDQLLPILRGALKTFIVVIAALVTSQNLGLNITSVLASLSVVGLALGLAAQDTVANLFGAATVFLDKPFKVGDRIKLDAVDGTVEQIGIRSTRVRNLDGHLITVPNKTMGNATITNITRRPNIKTTMTIGITYNTPTAKVKEALAILADVFKHPKTSDVIISFNQFADSSLNITVIHWWNSTDFKDYMAGMQAFNLAIKERFDGADIGFAFPTRTLYVKQDSDWKLGAASAAIPGVDAPKP